MGKLRFTVIKYFVLDYTVKNKVPVIKETRHRYPRINSDLKCKCSSQRKPPESNSITTARVYSDWLKLKNHAKMALQ